MKSLSIVLNHAGSVDDYLFTDADELAVCGDFVGAVLGTNEGRPARIEVTVSDVRTRGAVKVHFSLEGGRYAAVPCLNKNDDQYVYAGALARVERAGRELGPEH